LTDESPTDATGRKRFSFSTPQGESSAESILKALVAQSVTQTREFTMARPDLESIFLKATKRSWEQTDSSQENAREVSATLQPDEEEEGGAK
jgi:ABC-type nitrate/sulfonate/bicarbonate transport system substrate-binding protein